MPNTASEGGPSESGGAGVSEGRVCEAPTYRFAFSWEGPYGRAVRLVEEHAAPGLVLDLGCGYGAVGEVLVDRGRQYVGADVDSPAIADLGKRGLEGHLLDLTAGEGLGESLAEIIAGRPVGAVLLLDALEHLVDPLGVLDELAALWDTAAVAEDDLPVLITSIPNVAHFDLAAKLVGGRWDVTPSGLLDRTHLQMFTAERIARELAGRGWHECGQSDVHLDHSDQSFPVDYPFLVEGGTARDYLWSLRALSDPHGTVNQFVRAYRLERRRPVPGEADGGHRLRTGSVPDPAMGGDHDDGGDAGNPQPFLSVLTRTQGVRPAMLSEALACLAAQTVDSLEVVVLVHTDADADADADALATSVRALVDTFADGFASRVRVEEIRGGGRAAPLNAGLALARGRYIACLDDDDLVTADWAENFQKGVAAAPGKIIRSVSYSRKIRRAGPGETGGERPVTLTKPALEFPADFDLLGHFQRNATPLMTFAFPRSLVTELHFSFDDQLVVCEDWDLFLRAALIVGVVESGAITAIYQRWESDGTTTAHVPIEAWHAAHRQLLEGLDAKPLLLPPGSASGIARLVRDSLREEAMEEVRRELRSEIDAMEARARNAEQELDSERQRFLGQLGEAEERARSIEQDRNEQLEIRHLQHLHIVAIEERLVAVEGERDALANSRWWQMTAPLRTLTSRARTVAKRIG